MNLIVARRSEAEIVEHFVTRYGERILREPRGVRSMILGVTPWLALALGGLGIFWYLRQSTQSARLRARKGITA
jgi:cytochrome c-type biogenesis protein CcmH/NrfF